MNWKVLRLPYSDMKKKLLYIIGAILFVTLIVYSIYRTYQFETAPMKRLDLSEYPNEVINYSSIPYLDTVTHVMLKNMNIKGVRIVLLDVKNSVSLNIMDGSVVNGFVVERFDGVLQVFIKPKSSKLAVFQTLAHELVHVKQVIDGRLKVIDRNNAVWMGDTVDINGWEYIKRPWEVEAYDVQNSIRWDAINFLYE